MAGDVTVVGAARFHEVAIRLNKAGDGAIVRQMSKELRRQASPLQRIIQDRAKSLESDGARGGASARADRAAQILSRSRRPSERARMRAHQSSGLRMALARTVGFQVRTGGSSASMRMRSNPSQMPASQRKLPSAMNRGTWRHQVFGNPDRWARQTARPAGWFDQPVVKHGPAVRDNVLASIDRMIIEMV